MQQRPRDMNKLAKDVVDEATMSTGRPSGVSAKGQVPPNAPPRNLEITLTPADYDDGDYSDPAKHPCALAARRSLAVDDSVLVRLCRVNYGPVQGGRCFEIIIDDGLWPNWSYTLPKMVGDFVGQERDFLGTISAAGEPVVGPLDYKRIEKTQPHLVRNGYFGQGAMPSRGSQDQSTDRGLAR